MSIGEGVIDLGVNEGRGDDPLRLREFGVKDVGDSIGLRDLDVSGIGDSLGRECGESLEDITGLVDLHVRGLLGDPFGLNDRGVVGMEVSLGLSDIGVTGLEHSLGLSDIGVTGLEHSLGLSDIGVTGLEHSLGLSNIGVTGLGDSLGLMDLGELLWLCEGCSELRRLPVGEPIGRKYSDIGVE